MLDRTGGSVPTAEAVRGAVVRAQAGDTAAFATLYSEHVRAVRAVVQHNVSNDETVADLVQEVFVRALEALPGLREPERFRPWLLSIARYTSIDHIRARSRLRVSHLDEEDEPAEVEAGPELLAELRDLTMLVEGQVAGLRVRDATAITLVSHLGFSPAEVAQAMGLSVGAAKVVVHRARRRLRDALVLELMVRRQGAGCETFVRLSNNERLVDAAKHVRSCEVCGALAQADSDMELAFSRDDDSAYA